MELILALAATSYSNLNIIVNPSPREDPVTASLATALRVPNGRRRVTNLDPKLGKV